MSENTEVYVPGNYAGFAYSARERILLDLLNERAGIPKQCARSAIHHLERGHAILATDPEMTIFRCITAEEEAATSVIQSLKSHCYDGSEKLKPWNHHHKSGVTPFLRAIARMYMAMEEPRPKFEFVFNTVERLIKTRLEIPERGWAYPIPPLNFMFSRNGEDYFFQDELHEIASAKGKKAIREHIAEEANTRNRLLYASDKGIPRVGGNIEKEFQRRKDCVFNLLQVYIMIDQSPGQQSFVQHCLTSYLSALSIK